LRDAIAHVGMQPASGKLLDNRWIKHIQGIITL